VIRRRQSVEPIKTRINVSDTLNVEMRGVKYTYGTPTKFPELFHLQQASPELPLRPIDGSHVFFYGYFICQPLITAYSVNTSFIDCSYSVWVFRN